MIDQFTRHAAQRWAGWGLTAAAAWGGCLLAGCASSADTPPSLPEPTVTSVAPVTEAGQLVLPLDAYSNSHEQSLTIQRAGLILEGRCVARFDVPYTKDELPITTGIFAEQNIRRYGLFDPVSAAVRGYMVPPDILNDEPMARWNASPEEYAVVNGVTEDGGTTSIVDRDGNPVPEGGCGGEVDRALYGGLRDVYDPMYLQQLGTEAYDRGLQDSRVREVTEQWSACMAEYGYDYSDPAAANDDAAERRASLNTASADEIAQAVADVACKERVNYIGVRFAVETAYQNQIIEREGVRLREQKDAFDTLLRNAVAILGDDASSPQVTGPQPTGS